MSSSQYIIPVYSIPNSQPMRTGDKVATLCLYSLFINIVISNIPVFSFAHLVKFIVYFGNFNSTASNCSVNVAFILAER